METSAYYYITIVTTVLLTFSIMRIVVLRLCLIVISVCMIYDVSSRTLKTVKTINATYDIIIIICTNNTDLRGLWLIKYNIVGEGVMISYYRFFSF